MKKTVFDENPTDTQECVITKYRDETKWTVDCSDSKMMTKFEKAGFKPLLAPSAFPYKRYKVPAKCISIRKPRNANQLAQDAVKSKSRVGKPFPHSQEKGSKPNTKPAK